MSLGTIQISGETLSSNEVKDINNSLRNHSVTLLSLRNCKISDDDYQKLIRSVGKTSSLLQLNLNLGMVNSDERTILLADALNRNRSIQSLYLHGTPMGDDRFGLISKSLSNHPSLVDLDIGDCMLGDKSVRRLCNMLPPDGAKPGLKELVLSGNPQISSNGWSFLFCALASSSCLTSICLDYNPNIGDVGAKMLAVFLAGNSCIKKIDLEACNLTDNSAKVWLDMLRSYPTPLHTLNLTENKISKHFLEDIMYCLKQDSSSDEA